MAEEKKDKDKEKEGVKKEVKKGGKKMMIIIGAIVTVAIALGAGVFFALKGSGDKKEKTEAVDGEEAADGEGAADGKESTKGGEEGKHGTAKGGEGEGHVGNALLPLDTFIVNLQVKGSFLKTTIQLEFDKPELPPEMETGTAKIRDAIIRVLSTKTAQEILTPEGKEQLREEVKNASNEVINSGEVIAVYITEFIIQ